MDVASEILDKLFIYGLWIIEYLSPYSMEIVIGLVIGTFFFAFIKAYI